MNRRELFLLLGSAGSGYAQRALDPGGNRDWVCPMDPDYRADKPGACPKCGMKLVLGIPERVPFDMELSHSPASLKAGDLATLSMRMLDPRTEKVPSQFEIVHEKLMHLFVVSENLEFFAHVHPDLQPDGSFRQQLRLPNGGMYRLLADFYPASSVPQLALGTLYVNGKSAPANPVPSLAQQHAANLSANLRLEPAEAVAGLEIRLYFTLNPQTGLEPYLGAWAHLLAASSDLIDLMHLHPALRNSDGSVQFNLLFPRPGIYRIWTQFQREGIVDTVVFTIPVSSL